MIKILQVTDKISQRRGISIVIMNYYRTIDRTIVQFDFLVNEIEDDLKREIEKLGGKIFIFPQLSLHHINGFVKYMNDFFTNHGSDYVAVHSHFCQANYWVFKYARRNGIVNRISHSHATKFSAGGWVKNTRNALMNQMGMGLTTHYFACSIGAGVNMFGRKRLQSSKFHLIYNAINAEKFRFNSRIRKQIREDLHISEETYLLGIVASLSNRKNQRFIIELMPRLLKYNSNIKLLLLGDGDIKDELKQLVNRLSVKDNVIFKGTVSNVYDFLQGIDCFLLPSRLEGLPLSVVEAEAAGLHCVLSDAITREMNIENLCLYCSLEEPQDWIDAILNNIGTERCDTIDYINKYHYNLNLEADNLCSLYKSMLLNK